jgi:hypothetical protein
MHLGAFSFLGDAGVCRERNHKAAEAQRRAEEAQRGAERTMKFTIRDLFLMTVVVALALGWWVDHQRTATDRDEARKDAKLLVDHSQDPFLKMHPNRIQEIAKKYVVMPNSQAPAPNRSKNQSATNVDP